VRESGSHACCSPQVRGSQLSSQSLAVYAIACQYSGYGASGRLLSRQKTGKYGEGDSSSVQTDARTGAPTVRLPAQGPASHANNSAVLRQTIAVSFASAGGASAGTFRSPPGIASRSAPFALAAASPTPWYAIKAVRLTYCIAQRVRSQQPPDQRQLLWMDASLGLLA
jgi:hypothetical protein